MSDFSLQDEGSIVLLRMHTPVAQAWVEDHICEPTYWTPHAIVIEHRYIGDVLEGIIADGLEVR